MLHVIHVPPMSMRPRQGYMALLVSLTYLCVPAMTKDKGLVYNNREKILSHVNICPRTTTLPYVWDLAGLDAWTCIAMQYGEKHF